MASTYLSRTCGSTASSYTVSMWVKTSKTQGGTTSALWWNSATNKLNWEFNGTSQMYIYTGSTYRTTASFTDVNGWYHIVWSVNAGTGTLYVNNESALIAGSPTGLPALNSSNDIQIGGDNGGSTFDGIMSHVHFIDGTAYNATAFGETDATTGEWTIKTSPSVTYGTNGFFILKDGNSVTDQSGNSNNLTVAGGTLTKTEDCPDNVFATLNPLAKMSTSTLSHGNTTEAKSNGKGGVVSTLAVNSGKYYCEVKINTVGVDPQIGIYAVGGNSKGYPTSYLGNSYDQAPSMGWLVNGAYAIGYNASNSGSVGSAFTVGDIMMIALDMDNSKVWWGKNGTWFNSGDPANGTNAQFTNVNSDYHAFATGSNANNESGNYSFNFGNGYFGTTQISSAGTNASGIGIFEYDVPTGYTALSTKGLNL